MARLVRGRAGWWDLDFGDGAADGFGCGVGLGCRQRTRRRSWRARRWPSSKPTLTRPVRAAAQVLGDGCGGGLAEDGLDVASGEPPAGEGADGGQDVEVAVAGLFVAVAASREGGLKARLPGSRGASPASGPASRGDNGTHPARPAGVVSVVRPFRFCRRLSPPPLPRQTAP